MSTQALPAYEIETAPTEAELLARARALHPMLRARAEEIDAAGSVPEDIIDAFRDAGFFKLLQPKRWGGYEANPLTFLRVLMEVARGGSGSAAWVLMILGTHQWEFGMMDPQAGDDVWGQDNNVLVSSSYASAGTAEKVEGGFILNGKWPTSSGCLNSKWAFVATIQPSLADAEVPEWRAYLVPLSDAEICDDWQVCGLAGTGSRSIKFSNVFIPDYRSHSLSHYALDGRPSLYLYPFRLLFWTVVAALITGLGQCAIDMFIAQTQGKKRTGSSELLSDNLRIQEKLGGAQAIINGCRSRIEATVLGATSYTSNRQLVPDEVMVQYFDVARTGEQVQQAVISLFNLMGASVASTKTPFQRIFRDTMVACVHPTQRFDMEAELMAKQMYSKV